FIVKLATTEKKEKKKQMTKLFVISKSKITTIALILLLTISAILVAFPYVIAQTETKKTYPFIGAIPNPVGVNQEVLIHVGISHQLASVEYGWENLTVTVTKPDGTSETLGPYRTDATGGTGAVYVPTMVGTYTLRTNFPEQILDVAVAGTAAGTLMEASTSEPLDLIVQDESIQYYQAHSLPNEYWARPIDAQLREWSTITGNWLERRPPNFFAAGNGDAPESAHILWAKPLQSGGLIGGDFDALSYEHGDAYEGKWVPSVIINGILYYNLYEADGGSNVEQKVCAVDLKTGEELWCKTLGNNERLEFGQIMYWDSYNVHGAYPYLWTVVGSTWNAYDPFTGRLEYSMAGVPRITNLYGSKGEIYGYTVNINAGWMTMWNSSRVVSDEGSWLTAATGTTLNASRGIEWNVTIPTGLPGSAAVYLEDRVIGGNFGGTGRPTPDPVALWGISARPGHEGELLFNTTWNLPSPGMYARIVKSASLEDGVFVVGLKETRQYCAFSIDTGKKLWGPTESEQYLNMYSILSGGSHPDCIVYGKLITTGMAGTVNCYNVKTGTLLWTFAAHDPCNEILWSANWPLQMAFVTDGKVYVSHQEHSTIDPRARGAPFICLDIETGDVIWKMDGGLRSTRWGGGAIIADSTIALFNTYDNQIYALGKGPSAITVTAPDMGVPLGSSVILRGTVTDESAGTKESVLTARFPNGVPVVSDACMSEWMKYVYMQFERPADAVGVTVKLEAVDPNGNYQNLGTATSDSYGNYGFTFEPEIEGQYTIIATFEGSDSYYGSTSTTYLTVDSAPSASTPIEPDTETPDNQTPDNEQPDIETPDTETPDTEAPTTEAPLISTEVAIITAVAVACVIGAAAFWTLRKRK
ncbi:MAG: hypothetical protein CW691_03905, partial [Candidatus Bathyarchaeum sp.]